MHFSFIPSHFEGYTVIESIHYDTVVFTATRRARKNGTAETHTVVRTEVLGTVIEYAEIRI